MVSGSLGGTIELSDGADSLTAEDATAATLLGGTENDTFNFTDDVKDSSIVGGFGVDSLVVTVSLEAPLSTVVLPLMVQVPSMVLTISALVDLFLLLLFTATPALTHSLSVAMPRLHPYSVVLTMI